MARALRALFFGIGLLSLAIACVSFALLSEIRRPGGESDEQIEIVVEPGETTNAVATKLRAEGLIQQPMLFFLPCPLTGPGWQTPGRTLSAAPRHDHGRNY